MKTETVVQKIKQVREGNGDFASLIDQIHSQAREKKKMISMDAVKRARQLNENLEQLN